MDVKKNNLYMYSPNGKVDAASTFYSMNTQKSWINS